MEPELWDLSIDLFAEGVEGFDDDTEEIELTKLDLQLKARNTK